MKKILLAVMFAAAPAAAQTTARAPISGQNAIPGLGAAIEAPPDPAHVEFSICVLKDPAALPGQKLDAMLPFLEASNLTDEAFWTLIAVARDQANTDEVRTKALFSLATGMAYTKPDDFERGRNLVKLMLDDRFKEAFDALGADPAATVRQQRLYFFGAATINTHPAMVKALVPVFLPMLLSSLNSADEWFVMNEGLWSLSRFAEIGVISIDQAAVTISKIASSDRDEGVREYAATLLSSR